MSFAQSNFATIGAHSTKSPRIYSYESTDSLATVTTANYFFKKRFQFNEGDFIFAQLSDGSAILEVGSDTGTASESTFPTSNCTIGLIDYNDLATASTPLVVTVAGSPVILTNDGAGANTNKDHLPPGVTELWDVDNDMFDWSELKLGDMVDIRLDIQVITASVNTEVSVDLHLGTGGSAYTIPFITATNFKTTGTKGLNRFNGIYMGDANTLDNGGQFKITTDKDCTVIVVGWYMKALIRG